MKMRSPILIVGGAWSGDNIVASVFLEHDIPGGAHDPSSRDMRSATTPWGRYPSLNIRVGNTCELYALQSYLIKPFLISVGADPQAQLPLPDMGKIREISTDNQRVTSWRESVDRIVQDMWLHQYNHIPSAYFLKCSKSDLIWPMWHAAFPDAKWIIVRRERSGWIEDVLSCRFMRGRCSWAEWVDAHILCLDEIESCPTVTSHVVDIDVLATRDYDGSGMRAAFDMCADVEWSDDKASGALKRNAPSLLARLNPFRTKGAGK